MKQKRYIHQKYQNRLLLFAWASPTMPEFVSSMPVYGVDGTLKKRGNGNGNGGRAHLKGGTLDGVRCVAGYVLDRNGRRHAVAWLVNHANAGATQAAQDALIDWIVNR